MNAAFEVWLTLTLKSALLLGAAAALTRLLRNSPARARYRIWAVAFLCALVLPLSVNLVPSLSIGTPLRELTPPAGQSIVIDSRAVVPARVPAPFKLDWSWLIVLWPAGAAVVSVRFLLGLMALRRMARAAVAADPAWRSLVSEVAAEHGMRRTIGVYQSVETRAPLTWGILRPAILLPADAGEWLEPQRYAVVRHELEHIRRHDCLMQTFAQATCALHWLNPLAWLGARELQRLREQACDAAVVASGVGAAEYGAALIDLSRQSRLASLPVAPLAAPDDLERRIRSIATPPTARARLAFQVVVLLLIFPTLSGAQLHSGVGNWRTVATDRTAIETGMQARVSFRGAGSSPGSITVEPWDAPRVEVEARKNTDATGDAAARALADVRLTSRGGEGFAEFVLHTPDRAAGSSATRFDVTLRVPRAADLFVDLPSGRIHVGDILGGATLRTGGGGVRCGTIGGDLEVDSGGGAIEIAAARRALRVRTEGGPIEIGSAAASAEVRTGAGAVSMAVAGGSTGPIRIESGGGTITVTLPPDATPRIDAAIEMASPNAHRIDSAFPLSIGEAKRIDRLAEPLWRIEGHCEGTLALEITTANAGIVLRK